MKNIKYKILVFLILVTGFSNNIFGQLPPAFSDTVDDTSSPAPISGLLALGLIVGAVIGYKNLKNRS